MGEFLTKVSVLEEELTLEANRLDAEYKAAWAVAWNRCRARIKRDGHVETAAFLKAFSLLCRDLYRMGYMDGRIDSLEKEYAEKSA